MGWRAKIAACVLLSSSQVGLAATTFEPKVEEVCVPATPGSSKLVMSRAKVLAKLIQRVHGIDTEMMNVSSGGAVYKREVEILLDPLALCAPAQLANGSCKDADSAKLGEALSELQNFLQLHQRPVDEAKGGIDTRPLAISGESGGPLTPASVLHFLTNAVEQPLAACYKPVQPAGGSSGGGGSGATAKNDETAPFISLRQTVDDLKYSQTSPRDAQGFKAAKAANLAASNDRILDKHSVTVNAALGYVFPRRSFDEKGNFIGQFIPFVTYDQQFIQTTSPKTSSYIQNLGAGMTGDMTLFERHNLAATPKYTESLRNNARVFSGTFAYTPMYGIPGIDSALYVIPETLSFVVTPQLKYIIRDVTSAGTNLTVLNPGDYSWYGGRVNLSMFGEGLLDGFTYNIGYEQYAATEGNLKHISNFLTSIAYSYGDAKLVSIMLQYQRGRNLDTLESVNLFTLGLGLKY